MTPETWIGVLFCCSTAVAPLLVAPWVLKAVPSGMPYRGPDMSLTDMHLVATSDEAAGSV